MEDEKITLDVKAFRTLASDSRIAILKSLDERRRTLTELSKRFGLSVSTVSEHMDKLVEAELVRLVDDGHKWKYYELTRKGHNILHPGTTKIWVMLAVSAFGIFYVCWDLMQRWPPVGGLMVAGRDLAATTGGEMMTEPAAVKGVCQAVESLAAPAGLPVVSIIGMITFSVLLGFAAAMLVYAKKETKV